MNPKNSYEGRWRWWYESIADWMIANPDGTLIDCASALGKHVNTISLISRSDLFKDFYAKRRAEWRARHDASIIAKTTRIAELGLDIVLESMEKKRATVPLETLDRITSSALDRLGYGVKAPLVQVNNDNRTQVAHVQVSAGALAEARMAIRAVEDARRNGYSPLPAPSPQADLDLTAAESVEKPEQQEVETEIAPRLR